MEGQWGDILNYNLLKTIPSDRIKGPYPRGENIKNIKNVYRGTLSMKNRISHIRVPLNILMDESLDCANRMTLISVMSFFNKQGFCWPSYEAISQRSGLGRTKTYYCLVDLIDKGYLTKYFDETRSKSTHYRAGPKLKAFNLTESIAGLPSKKSQINSSPRELNSSPRELNSSPRELGQFTTRTRTVHDVNSNYTMNYNHELESKRVKKSDKDISDKKRTRSDRSGSGSQCARPPADKDDRVTPTKEFKKLMSELVNRMNEA